MTLQILIGTDTSVENADVYVEATNGTVSITGPFDGWMGYAELADFETAAEGDALALRIADNPAEELAALGYSGAEWFRPV